MEKKDTKWCKPEITDLGDAKDIIKGIPGGDKEVGTADGEFLPLQVS
tara:strand:- start:152 stop:292 length:141 start_codon:yes stop_codon:yes gene_type:complete